MKKVFWVFLWFSIILLSGCTYSKQEERLKILPGFSYIDNTRFYVIVYKKIYQRPTGISTFPNGGVQKVNNQILYFFMCDIDKKSCVETGKFSKNDLIDAGILEAKYNLHLMGSDPIDIYVPKSDELQKIYTIFTADIDKGTLHFVVENNLKNKTVSFGRYTVLPKNIRKSIKVNYKLSIYSDIIKIAPKSSSYKSYKTIFELDHNSSKIDLKYVLN